MPHFTNGDNHNSGCLAARDHVASLTEVEIMSHSPEFRAYLLYYGFRHFSLCLAIRAERL